MKILRGILAHFFQSITVVRADTIGYDRRVTVNLGTVVTPNMVVQIQPGVVHTQSCTRF